MEMRNTMKRNAQRAMGVVVAVLMAAVLAGTAHGATVTNASFETNGGNNTAPADWDLITNSYGSWDGITAKDGTWVLHAGAGFGNGGRYQDVATTVGQQYDLEFWAVGFNSGLAVQDGLVQVGTPGANDNDLALNNNAELVDARFSVPLFTDAADWTQFNHTFTATSGVTRLSYQNIGQGSGNNAINIDAVTLTEAAGDIPEPATMALLGLAAAGLGGYVRRRRSA